jgi:hypothetical protein
MYLEYNNWFAIKIKNRLIKLYNNLKLYTYYTRIFIIIRFQKKYLIQYNMIVV